MVVIELLLPVSNGIMVLFFIGKNIVMQIVVIVWKYLHGWQCFFFLFPHSSLMVKWGLHLTRMIMSFLVCYAALKHNCLRKAYKGLFKLKFLISTKTKKHDLNILFPLTFHKLKMILVMNLLNKIRIKVGKKSESRNLT